MSTHHLLLVFLVPATAGRERIVALLERSKAFVQFQNFSGLYKKFSNIRREDLNAELIVAAHCTCDLQVYELQAEFQRIENEDKKSDRAIGRVCLLAWDDSVSLLPQLTIPHPSLIEDQLILLCSAEAYGDFVHPIMRKSLKELLTGVSQSPLAEFVSQPHFLGLGSDQ